MSVTRFQKLTNVRQFLMELVVTLY